MAKNTGRVTDDTPAGKLGLDPRDPWYLEINRAAASGVPGAVKKVEASMAAGEPAPGSTLSVADATKTAIGARDTDDILNQGAWDASWKIGGDPILTQETPSASTYVHPNRGMVEPKGYWPERREAEKRDAEARTAKRDKEIRRRRRLYGKAHDAGVGFDNYLPIPGDGGQ